MEILNNSRLLKIICVSDFAFYNSGIYSCLTRIVRNLDCQNVILYSDQKELGYEELDLINLPNLNAGNVLIFTHLEYSKLGHLLTVYPNAVIYVPDWPGVYWDSIKSNSNFLKGILGKLRFYRRIWRLPRRNKYIFVAIKDSRCARKYGFINARYLPLGVEIITIKKSIDIDVQTICFTGNFRYEPNLSAARELLFYAKSNPDFKFLFAGFHANELSRFRYSSNVEVLEDVDSIIKLLCDRRPIFVSNLKFGAGAKNKIVEALISTCPVIATKESLDDSLIEFRSVLLISDLRELRASTKHIQENSDYYDLVTKSESQILMDARSWEKITNELLEIIHE